MIGSVTGICSKKNGYQEEPRINTNGHQYFLRQFFLIKTILSDSCLLVSIRGSNLLHCG